MLYLFADRFIKLALYAGIFLPASNQEAGRTVCIFFAGAAIFRSAFAEYLSGVLFPALSFKSDMNNSGTGKRITQHNGLSFFVAGLALN